MAVDAVPWPRPLAACALQPAVRLGRRNHDHWWLRLLRLLLRLLLLLLLRLRLLLLLGSGARSGDGSELGNALDWKKC